MESDGRKSDYINIKGSVQPRSVISDDNTPSGNVSTTALGSSVTYDSIDYEVLNKDNRCDDYDYGRIKTAPTELIHLPNKTVASGRRILFTVIAILLLLFVAAAVTFMVLYIISESKTGAPEVTTPTPRQTTVLSSSSEESPRINTTASLSTTTMSTTTTTMEPLGISDRCQTYAGLIAHPDECQLYYNCSNGDAYVRSNFEKYMMECPYPLLFSTETMSCEHFEKVTCGNRTEAKDGCDYRALRCIATHCSPCDSRYPACTGKDDGLHAHENRLWSLWYIICYKERFVTKGLCLSGQRFSPEYNGCVSSDRIPSEHGGSAPNCTGKPDGYHEQTNETKLWSPNYILCLNEIFATELKCPNENNIGLPLYFSPEYRGCVSLDRIPPEHGGMAPNCTGKPDGYYPNEHERCSDLYTECRWEHHIQTLKCPEGEIFFEVTKSCSNSSCNSS